MGVPDLGKIPTFSRFLGGATSLNSHVFDWLGFSVSSKSVCTSRLLAVPVLYCMLAVKTDMVAYQLTTMNISSHVSDNNNLDIVKTTF